jgi:hypothetical protein
MHWRTQRKLIDQAVAGAPDPVKRYVLSATIEDTRAFCWGALERFGQRGSVPPFGGTPQDYGRNYVELHVLLIVAHEAVWHLEVIEWLLKAIGEPADPPMPPRTELRDRLREARNSSPSTATSACSTGA